MTLTKAMSKALDLHPVRTMPRHNAWENTQDDIEAFQAANRVRASLTNDSWPHKVFAFHRLYRMPGGDGPVRQLDSYRRTLRERLFREEFNETVAANEANDLLETIDGLFDTIYVAIGWLLELGLTPDEINRGMEEVHASNMTKVDENGRPVFDDGGKVLKGDHYVRVNLPAAIDSLAKALANEEPNNGN